MEKPENYDEIYRKYKSHLIKRNEMPDDCLFYLRYKDYLYEHPELKNVDLSKEEFLKIKNENSKNGAIKRKQWWDNISSDKKESIKNKISETKKSMSEEDKRSISKIISEKAKLRWKNKSKEEISNLMKPLHDGWSKKWANMNDDEKSVKIKSLVDGYKNKWDSLSDEDKANRLNRLQYVHDNWWNGLSEEDKNVIRNKKIETWRNKSEEDLREWSMLNKNRWLNLSDDEKSLVINRLNEWRNNASPDQINNKLLKHHQWWESLSIEERNDIIHRLHSHSNGNNNLHKKIENKFIDSEYQLIPEYPVYKSKEVHRWDYAIFRNNQLECVVDLDGAYYHADICDYDGVHSKYKYDINRSNFIPPNTKHCIIREKDFDVDFKWLIKILEMTFDEFIITESNMLYAMPFPYPSYTDKELIDSFNKLQTMNNEVSSYIDSHLGDRIIYHFFHSLYDEKIWTLDWILDSVRNHRIYYSHLNKNKILMTIPHEEFISPGNARIKIINNEISPDNDFDPGIMLAMISLGRKYKCNNLSDTKRHEIYKLLSFLETYNIGYNIKF